MSELEERLNAVLSNPEEMSRLADMAQKLMGNLASESAAPPAPPSGGLAGLAAGLGGGGGLGGILSQVLGQTAGGKKPLTDALAPYLSADRARRLSRALRIGAAARIALAAFSEWGRGDGV